MLGSYISEVISSVNFLLLNKSAIYNANPLLERFKPGLKVESSGFREGNGRGETTLNNVSYSEIL